MAEQCKRASWETAAMKNQTEQGSILGQKTKDLPSGTPGLEQSHRLQESLELHVAHFLKDGTRRGCG